MADKTDLKATTSAWHDEASDLHHLIEHKMHLEDLLHSARKGNEDIAHRMRDMLGGDILHLHGHGAHGRPQSNHSEPSKLLSSPENSHRIVSPATNPKNPTTEPIERLLARAREEGYNIGWRAGKEVGYKIGMEDGQDLGMMEGKKIGLAQGKAIGMAAGLAEGKTQTKK